MATALSEKVKTRIGDLEENPDQLVFNTKDSESSEGEEGKA